MERLVVLLVLGLTAFAVGQLIMPWQACEMQCLKENNATYPFKATPEINNHCRTYCMAHWQDMYKHLIDQAADQ